MSEVATIPEVDTQWPEPPHLLVEWSSRWEEFESALPAALTRAPKALAGEAPIGMFPYRGMLVCWLLECLLLIAIIVLPERFVSLEIPPPPTRPQWDVIYYSGDELPQTQDRGGAEAGKSGRAGGQQAHHRTQTIRVARGDKPTEKVVDAPRINLPHSDSAVANLLAFKPIPGPPPAEGLRSSLVAPALPAMAAVPPSPELNSSANRAANSLTPSIVPPAPEVSHTATRGLNAATLQPAIIPPAPNAPNVSRDKMRTATPLAPTVVAPAPVAPAHKDAPRDLASSRVPLTQSVDVIAPPVSAPPRDVSSAPKLTLPAPAVIAPPPSEISRDLNSWGSSATGDLRTKPVPPPPAASTSGGGSLARSGVGTLGQQVVPPPASIDGHGIPGSGTGRSSQSAAALLGSADVVPPPPGLGGGRALTGSGRGNKGIGTGSPLDLGSSVAPPSNGGGNTAGNGVVLSSQPGPKVGLPNANGGGALAMSPTGTANSGLGGSGGGSGIGKGNGPGSGLKGEGSGAGKEGAGRGSDPNAHGGISPYPGPGGSGTGSNGTPAMPGVSVQGGTTTITLPSFGAPGGDAPSSGPGHSSVNDHKRSGVTVIATSRSGGVLPYYGLLKGDNYSIYITTSLGTAVMQYSDPSSATHASREALSEPEPLRKELPDGLRPTRLIIACTIDRSGDLKDLKVLEPGAADTTSRILVALHSWKFRPAFRANDPVEVTAILGFGIDTR
ncbi:MAG: hypothetical protein WCD02_20760 [Terriglobales bacterium]